MPGRSVAGQLREGGADIFECGLVVKPRRGGLAEHRRSAHGPHRTLHCAWGFRRSRWGSTAGDRGGTGWARCRTSSPVVGRAARFWVMVTLPKRAAPSQRHGGIPRLQAAPTAATEEPPDRHQPGRPSQCRRPSRSGGSVSNTFFFFFSTHRIAQGFPCSQEGLRATRHVGFCHRDVEIFVVFSETLQLLVARILIHQLPLTSAKVVLGQSPE